MPYALCALALCVTGHANAAETLEKVDQADLNGLVTNGQGNAAFLRAFEAGDELSEFEFTADQGVGANIGEGRRFTRFPRADLNGAGEWATHFPKREGGANATSCISCHSAPFANGAGGVAMNVVLDPDHTGDPSQYLERNTTSLFALSIPQRLAEEMSVELYLQRQGARDLACSKGAATVALVAKEVEFGTLSLTRINADPCEVKTDTSQLAGIDADLVVRPFGWKGNHATIRAFTRDAAHNELGLQATELVGARDGDYDGVIHELSVGDVTALTLYMAALERPVSTVELADFGLIELTVAQRSDIAAGEHLFATAGCSGCHVPSMTIANPTFSEPSQTAGYHDVLFPDGSDPGAHGLGPETAITFNMRLDPPNNQVLLENGNLHHLGALETDADGNGRARWFSNFKRHDMGPALSDPSDPLGMGASMFMTRSLAGVGSTGPWLHDGRATTLDEAILTHGGEATASRHAYAAMSDADAARIVTFLESLILFIADTAH
ncbi:di-heme oxidoredictase family protein [Paracoccus sp. Ld10]|uniref:di-heme oxidoredictase family protein n=1 Tax=Paracoccus sp. Ld10 TaxID=649158 RepID=UPI003864D6EB